MSVMVPITCPDCKEVREVQKSSLPGRVTHRCRACWSLAVKKLARLPGRRKTADCKRCTYFIASHYGYPPRCRQIITRTGAYQSVYKIDRCPLPVNEGGKLEPVDPPGVEWMKEEKT